MKKKLLIAGVVLIAILGVVAISLKRNQGQKGIPVTLASVKSGPIVGKVSGHGPVNPEAIVDISAHLPGEITRLLVHEGDVVRKGQLLLALDPTKFSARAQEARAAMASRKSQVELSRAQNEKAESDLKRAERLQTQGLLSQ